MSRAVGLSGQAGAEASAGASRSAGGYLERSKQPFTSLLFLLPLMVLYEVGTTYVTTDLAHHTEQRIVAFQMMQRFFHLFGATGRYLPALVLATVLLTSHMVRRDSWEIDLPAMGCMVVESLLLCAPLLVLNFLTAYYLPCRPHSEGQWSALLVLSIGAGIYEELVFRLVGLTVLSILLIDLLRVPRKWALLLMVAVSSVLFSAYHYWWGGETFSLRTFAFRAIGGAYFAAIFIFRGFGITCGTHAAYDILIVLYSVVSAA